MTMPQGGDYGRPWDIPTTTTAPSVLPPTPQYDWVGTMRDGRDVFTDGSRYYIDSGGFGDPVDFINAGTVNPLASSTVTTTGGSASPSPSASYPVQDPNTGQWGTWKDDGSGNLTWVPLAGGPSAAKQDPYKVQNPDGTYTLYDPTTLQPVGTIGTAEKQPMRPEISTTLANGNLGIWDPNTNSFFDTGTPGSADAPTMKTAPDGSMHQWDAVSKTWVRIWDAPPKDTTAYDIAAMQIAANQAQNDKRMAFDAAENAAQRAFQAEQAAKDRQVQLAIENARGAREHERTKLEAAKAFSEAVNSVDPTALPAFLAAGGGMQGGGSLVNAAATGANAITDKALLGPARMLGVARSEYKPVTVPGGLGATGGVGGGYTPPPPVQMTTMGTTKPVSSSGGPYGGYNYEEIYGPVMAAKGANEVLTKPTVFVAGEAGPEHVQITPLGKKGGIGTPPGIASKAAPRAQANYAEMMTRRPARAGGLQQYRSEPQVPMGSPALQAWAQLMARRMGGLPVRTAAEGFSGIAGFGDLFKNLFGGLGGLGSRVTTPGEKAPSGQYDPLSTEPTAEERALMEETRRLREETPVVFDPEYIYNLDFWNQSPTIQQSGLMGLQAHLGVKSDDWLAEARRMRPQGLGRAGVGIRY